MADGNVDVGANGITHERVSVLAELSLEQGFDGRPDPIGNRS